jgi:hypothetical protein
MQFVEFETNQGTRIWVNPAQIVMLGAHPGSATVTDLLVAGLGHKPLNVKGAIADVTKKLNEGLKA